MRVCSLAVKYWLQGDNWKDAKEYATALVKGFRRYDMSALSGDRADRTRAIVLYVVGVTIIAGSIALCSVDLAEKTEKVNVPNLRGASRYQATH
jgi:hypothetical protein